MNSKIVVKYQYTSVLEKFVKPPESRFFFNNATSPSIEAVYSTFKTENEISIQTTVSVSSRRRRRKQRSWKRVFFGSCVHV